ncbi:hypothetical protein TB2_023391 [Malus domestica]
MQQFASFVVGLLFVMHALGEFTTHAHQGKKEFSVTGNGPSDQQTSARSSLRGASTSLVSCAITNYSFVS